MKRKLVCTSILLILAIGIDRGSGPATATAQTRSTATMRERVYEKLSRAQEAAEAENWSKAFELLDDVRNIRDLDGYERAQLHTAYGYIYFAQEKYVESIAAYEKVLLEENLPEALETSTLYALSQLSFHLEDHEKAIVYLERWLTTTTSPGPDPLILLAQAYYQLGRRDDALDSVQRALAIAEQRGQPPREHWYVLLRALYFELEDYPKLLETLEVLVTRFPRKEYWIHLASVYGEMGSAERQVAAYEVAFAQGYLVTGRELLTLSQLLLQADVPYRAGVVLARGLEEGLVEGTAENWRLLSQMWVLAREDARAIDALTKAAGLSNDGELDARLAQSYANLDDWENAVAAARVALEKGVRAPHELQVMVGMALFELGRYDEAKTAFRTAQSSPEGRETASQWIVYVEREEERLSELERSLR